MPRESPVGAAERMLRVIGLVNELAAGSGAGKPVPLETFARMLGMEPAEVERAIDKVNLGCGDSLPELFVDYDPATRAVVPHRLGAALDRPLRLTPAEARALVAVVGAAGIGGGDALVDKIEGAFPPVAPERFKTVQNAARAGNLGPLLQTLTAAIGRHRALRIAYRGASDTAARERTVEPCDLAYDATEGMWYLGAWCRAAEGWRTFRLDRIEQAEETGETFGEEGRDRTGTAPSGLAGVDDAPLALLAVHDPQAVSDAYEWRGLLRVEAPRPWDARRLTEEDRARGGYIAAVPWAQGSAWLPRMVAQTFGRVEALRPLELRMEVARTARALRGLLRGPGQEA